MEIQARRSIVNHTLTDILEIARLPVDCRPARSNPRSGKGYPNFAPQRPENGFRYPRAQTLRRQVDLTRRRKSVGRLSG
jgi:hypothetical protein